MTRKDWLSSSWEKAFPSRRDPKKVVQFMHEQWRELFKTNPAAIDVDIPGNREPKITEFFCEHLRNNSVAGGLTGYFSYENQHGTIEPGATKLSRRIRTDIQYLFYAPNSPSIVHLVFEFKKLKNTAASRKSYYGTDGMLRFISGDYQSRWAYGFMVGLLDREGAEAVKQLKTALQKPGVASHPLHLIKDINGKLISDPSLNMPNIAHFDTKHSRTLHGENRDLMLCHLFFDVQ
ncbi:hypothetical protein ACFQPC_09245 [Herminiimonas glaciei]|uniref:Uncharacterized protein n=1 Tax=Herminiimonas glaciei TaxID=523788 RepID=A0ABW2IB98_9BURK